MMLGLLALVLSSAIVGALCQPRLANYWWDAGALTVVILQVVFVATWANPVDDRDVYFYIYQLLESSPTPFPEELALIDRGYLLLIWLLALLVPSLDTAGFFAILGALVSLSWWAAARLNFGAIAAMYTVVTLSASGFLAAYTGVALRHGLAIGLALIVLALMRRGANRRWTLPLAVVAGLFHWSVWPALLLVFLVHACKVKLVWVITCWAGLSVLFLTGFWNKVLAFLAHINTRFASYTASEELAEKGIDSALRLDFWALSLVLGLVLTTLACKDPLGAGRQLWNRIRSGRWMSMAFNRAAVTTISTGEASEVSNTAALRGREVELIVRDYFVLNMLFMVFGFAAFSDRLGIISWAYAVGAFWFILVSRRDRAAAVLSLLAAVVVTAMGVATGMWASLT